jgi:phosphatidylglycerol:prolipoprotein diacylglycerol transferase
VVGVTVAFACARRARIPLRPFALALGILTAAALIGAKLYGLIERSGSVGAWHAELASGYRYPGAVAAVTMSALLLSRVWSLRLSACQLLDLIAPSFAFALVVVRVGCLLAGCCAGAASDLPWAISFPARSQVWHAHLGAGLIGPDAAHSLTVHPLQLYFAGLSLTLGLFALQLERRSRFDGQVFLAFVAAYGAGQFLLEFLRARPLPHVQYLCGVFAVIAVLMLVVRGAASRHYRSTDRYLGREASAWR